VKLTFFRDGYVREAPTRWAEEAFAVWIADWEFDDLGLEWSTQVALRMLDYVEQHVDNPVSGDVE
jgi:hypothetical protein